MFRAAKSKANRGKNNGTDGALSMKRGTTPASAIMRLMRLSGSCVSSMISAVGLVTVIANVWKWLGLSDTMGGPAGLIGSLSTYNLVGLMGQFTAVPMAFFTDLWARWDVASAFKLSSDLLIAHIHASKAWAGSARAQVLQRIHGASSRGLIDFKVYADILRTQLRSMDLNAKAKCMYDSLERLTSCVAPGQHPLAVTVAALFAVGGIYYLFAAGYPRATWNAVRDKFAAFNKLASARTGAALAGPLPRQPPKEVRLTQKLVAIAEHDLANNGGHRNSPSVEAHLEDQQKHMAKAAALALKVREDDLPACPRIPPGTCSKGMLEEMYKKGMSAHKPELEAVALACFPDVLKRHKRVTKAIILQEIVQRLHFVNQ